MTNRLPIPGSDDGDWGDILNSFLEVSLASDGTVNPGVVGTAQLDSPTQTTLASVAGKYTLPNGGIPSTDLAGNIPASSLASSVQTNLSSASTAVQPSVTLSGDLSGTLSSPTVARIKGITLPSGAPATGQVLQATSSSSTNWATVTSSGSVNNATTASPGLVELAGDLGGTNTSASSPVLAATANVNSIISANSSVAGALQKTNNLSDLTTPSTARTNLGLGNSAVATIGTAAGTVAAGNDTRITGALQTGATVSGDLSGTLPAPTVAKIQGTNISTPSGGATSYLNATGTWTTPSGGSSASNATSSTPGLVQLDGDLGGTATSPTVAKISGITLPSSAPTAGNVLTATSASATAWSTPAAGVMLDSTASDIQTDTLTGTSVAGSVGKAADAGHQHPLVAHAHTTANTGSQLNPTTALNSTGTPSSSTFLRGDNTWSNVPTASNATTTSPGLVELAGDLGGTATAPTVTKVNGITLPSSAPTAGNVLTATSASATSWSTPAAGVMLDSTAADIQMNGTQAAGSTGKAADAGHVHPTDTSRAPLASPTFTGTPAAPTATAGDNTTKLATTAFVSSAITAVGTSGAQALTPTAVKTSAYTASPGDFIPVDASSGSVTITLPTAPADKTRVEVKMINTAVNATNGYGNNYVTFNTGSGDVLNKAGGSTTGTLTLPSQAIMLQYSASPAIWYIQSDDLPGASVVLGISHTVTSTYTLTNSDHVIMADATSAAFTITLPTAVGFNGRYTIDAIATGTNIVTVATTSSQTIDGASTTTLGTQTSGAVYNSIDLISDGANWRVI